MKHCSLIQPACLSLTLELQRETPAKVPASPSNRTEPDEDMILESAIATDEVGASLSLGENPEPGSLALTPITKGFNSTTTLYLAPIQMPVGSLDPFSALGIRIDSETAFLLRYFQTIWAQTAFQSATAGNQLQRFGQSETMQVIQRALADPLVSHAFLAAVAMRMTTVHNTDSRAEQHAAAALCELRKSLGQEDHDTASTLLSILFLAAYETYCFNLEGTKTHLRALKRMSAETHLTGYLKTLCHHIDLFSASSSLSPPIFSAPRVIYPENSPHTTVGRRFLEFAGSLGSKMSAVIANIISCANVAEEYKLRAAQGGDLCLNIQQFVTWSEALTYQLLDQMPGHLLKECCIIALLMWLSYLPVSIMASNGNAPPPPGQNFLKVIPGRGSGLVKRLKASTLDTHLHLWILAVGIVCAIDQDDTEFCAVEFTQLAHRLDVSDVRDCLRQFLWLDNFDLIDYDVLIQLLDPDTSAAALQIVVGWAATTKSPSVRFCEEKSSHVRVTNRPSNWYRLGA